MIVTVATLRAAGLSEAQIVKVVEAADNERVARRREQNRKASQKQRARQQSVADVADAHISILPSLSKSSSIDRPLPAAARAMRKTPLPADWQPTPSDRDYAKSKGWNDDRIEREAERFRLYYLANGKAWMNWHLVWCKWVISEFQNGNRGGQNGQGRRHGSVLDATDRLDEKLCERGATGGYVPGSSGPEPLRLDRDARAPRLKLVPPR